MNKYFWISFYFGQQCIVHPVCGRYTLTGFNDGLVYCRNGNYDISFPIETVQFSLKFCNPYLIKALSKLPFSYDFIKSKALAGYWMFHDDFNNVIYEG